VAYGVTVPGVTVSRAFQPKTDSAHRRDETLESVLRMSL